MKLIIFIAFTLSSLSYATDCEVRRGYTVSHNVCWSESVEAFVSRDCLSGKCDALNIKARFPAAIEEGSNRTIGACVRTGAGVIVLKDKRGNEESFCEYSDGSLRSAASVESSI